MKQVRLLSVVFVLALVFALDGCYYDKLDKLKPKTGCDTSGVISYATHIKPIMDQNCTNSCHGGSSPLGGLNLDTYASVKSAAVSGKLYSSITWDGTTSTMPKGGSKLDDCTIATIKKWIDSSYPQ